MFFAWFRSGMGHASQSLGQTQEPPAPGPVVVEKGGFSGVYFGILVSFGIIWTIYFFIYFFEYNQGGDFQFFFGSYVVSCIHASFRGRLFLQTD
jgi:hypothetical protein